MPQSKIQNNYTLNKKREYSKIANKYTLNKKVVESKKRINSVKYICIMYDEQSNAYRIPITAFNYNETIDENGDLSGNLQLSIPYPDGIEGKIGKTLTGMSSVIVYQQREFTDNTVESFFITYSQITNGNYQQFRQNSNLNLNCSVNILSEQEVEDFKNNNPDYNWTDNQEVTFVDGFLSRQTTNDGGIMFEVPPQFFTKAGKYCVINNQQYKVERMTQWVSRSRSTVQLTVKLQ